MIINNGLSTKFSLSLHNHIAVVDPCHQPLQPIRKFDTYLQSTLASSRRQAVANGVISHGLTKTKIGYRMRNMQKHAQFPRAFISIVHMYYTA